VSFGKCCRTWEYVNLNFRRGAGRPKGAQFDLLRQASGVCGGHEVDFTGDALFSAFEGRG
jgi:hypothetical protein